MVGGGGSGGIRGKVEGHVAMDGGRELVKKREFEGFEVGRRGWGGFDASSGNDLSLHLSHVALFLMFLVTANYVSAYLNGAGVSSFIDGGSSSFGFGFLTFSTWEVR